jgi:hypothetical protein
LVSKKVESKNEKFLRKKEKHATKGNRKITG